MKKLNKKRKKLIKTVLAATVMIGSVTALFQGLTQAAAAELGKKDIIPTSYVAVSNPVVSSLKSAPESTPEGASNSLESSLENVPVGAADSLESILENAPAGYKKANYTVADNDLPYYCDKKPTDKDISREVAAEIGAQALWTVFNLDLEGEELEMAYNPATEDNRAIWEGNWWIDGKYKSTQNYFFSVDAITGEIHSVQYARTLKENVSAGFDGTLAQSPQEYEALAVNVAEKYNAVHSVVKSAEYSGQGMSSNDPTISVRVTGENGEQAQIEFSRYDNALLSIAYDSWCKEADASIQRIEKEMQEWSEEVSTAEIDKAVLIPRP